MANFRCNTCDGVYSETTNDGLAYYHRCPFVPDPDATPPLPGEIDFREHVPRTDERNENWQPKADGTGVEIIAEGTGRSATTDRPRGAPRVDPGRGRRP